MEKKLPLRERLGEGEGGVCEKYDGEILGITDLKKRDDFRKKSVIAPACIKQISGLGKHSYLEGVKKLI